MSGTVERVAADVALVAMRREPSRAAERASEALCGEALEVHDVRDVNGDRWLRVSTPDGYRAWVAAGEVAPIGEDWPGPGPLVIGARHAVVWDPAGGRPIRRLSAGAILRRGEHGGGQIRVVFPSGTEGVVSAETEVPFHSDTRGAVVGGSPLERIATALLGIPYRWGGRSVDGFDCSGLVQRMLAELGIAAPRDAWQQEEWAAGRFDPVGRDLHRQGDIIFWGAGERATHVGIALDGSRFVHARHWVRVGEMGEGPDADLAAIHRATYRPRGSVPG